MLQLTEQRLEREKQLELKRIENERIRAANKLVRKQMSENGTAFFCCLSEYFPNFGIESGTGKVPKAGPARGLAEWRPLVRTVIFIRNRKHCLTLNLLLGFFQTCQTFDPTTTQITATQTKPIRRKKAAFYCTNREKETAKNPSQTADPAVC